MKSIFRGADVNAKHIQTLADDYRARLRDILKEPYENGCMCVSPDMWTDPYKQISYMGISISFVDKDLIYKSIDLCCEPYVQVNHSGENILLVKVTVCLASSFRILWKTRCNNIPYSLKSFHKKCLQ